MDGFTVWKLHRAIKLHFTSKKYDVFKYDGQVAGVSEEAFEKLRSRGIYEIIASRFDNPKHAVQFFISNFVYSDHDTAFEITSWDNYKLWIKHKEALTRFIERDLEKADLDDLNSDFTPMLLKQVVSGEVLPQTVVALDNHLHFLQDWYDKDYFAFGKTILKLVKLKPFLKYNEQIINQLINEKMEHRETI
jgi:hypothetical protein